MTIMASYVFGFRGVRPETPPYVPDVLVTLMQRCWHKDQRERPEFSEVQSHLIFLYNLQVIKQISKTNFITVAHEI